MQMRMSDLFLPTLKESPADAELASHKLMLKAGLIRKVSAGIYSYLPLGLKVLQKTERIVREEMNKAGAQEIKLPIIQPANLWKESGRWDDFGPEMFKLSDRKDRMFALGPTHEEIITDLVRDELNSYKDLPMVLYQINDKYRDEVRPRHGVMRSREFLMKDAYSFHTTKESLEATYQDMYDAYASTFDRLGLDWIAVEAPTGLMGGDYSEEFMALADQGGEEIVTCKSCSYASNVEIAESKVPSRSDSSDFKDTQRVPTPEKETIEEVSDFLGIPPEKIVKTFIFEIDDGFAAFCLKGDDNLEEMKLMNNLEVKKARMVTSEEEIEEIAGASFGSLGPVGLEIPVYADLDTRSLTNFVVGANEDGYHLTNVNWKRDVQNVNFTGLRKVKKGDKCPKCGSGLQFHRSIEIGQLFQLGTKYSQSLEGTFQDEQGDLRPYIMGCYGIGVSRLVPAIIQQNYEGEAIRWTDSVKPFSAVLVVLQGEDGKPQNLGDKLYGKLKTQGYDILLDDREASPGVKFNDADLIGIPVKIILGPRGLQRGQIEIELQTGEKHELDVDSQPFEVTVGEIERRLPNS